MSVWLSSPLGHLKNDLVDGRCVSPSLSLALTNKIYDVLKRSRAVMPYDGDGNDCADGVRDDRSFTAPDCRYPKCTSSPHLYNSPMERNCYDLPSCRWNHCTDRSGNFPKPTHKGRGALALNSQDLFQGLQFLLMVKLLL